MIVVDTNVLAYLLITGERSAEAERALRKDPFWAAPLLWRSELRNVLALYMRQPMSCCKDASTPWPRALSWRSWLKALVRPTTVNLSPWPKTSMFPC